MSRYDDGPVVGAVAITPGASPLAKPIRGFHCGAAGDVSVTLLDGTSVTFYGCLAGVFYPYACTHVTASTGGNLVGLF